MHMLNQICRYGVSSALTAAMALLASPASAQVPASPLPPPAQAAGQVAPAQPAGPALELTMDQAVELALQNNLGLASSRLDVDDAAQAIAQARASFLPRAQTTFTRRNSQQPAQQNADGTRAVSSTTSMSNNASLNQTLPWFGNNYSVSWSSNRRETPGNSGATFNPNLDSTFSFNITQPLLRGFKIDSARAGLESSERVAAITDIDVRRQVIQTETQVRLAYLNLIGARESQKVAIDNRNLDQQALENARARVEVGVAPQTDIIANEAAVASSNVSVIAAEATIAAAEDNLRQLILDPDRPDYWTVRLVPTETVELTPREVNLDEAIRTALDNRLDLEIAQRQLELTDLNLRVNRNSTLPDLNLQVGYSASGSGGRNPSGELGDKSFSSVLGEAFGGSFPTWQTSVTFGYPIGTTAAETAYARGAISRRQQVIGLRQLELVIVQQVRDAVRQVQNSFRQVDAAQAAVAASQQDLDAANRRFQVGIGTQLDLQFRQQNLARAKLTELNAILNYNRNLIQLDRVQRIQ
jgi:HAE1 family hydrophobic/amphiphilic exporter-1